MPTVADLLKVDDAQGHAHGDDGKFVTKTGAAKHMGEGAERVHSHGITVGYVKPHGGTTGKYVSHGPTGKKIGVHANREGAMDTVHSNYMTHAKLVHKSPDRLHQHTVNAYMPGEAKEHAMPAHKIRNMLRDSYILGAHYKNPVKSSRSNLRGMADLNEKALHSMAQEHLGAHEWKDADKEFKVPRHKALRAVKAAYAHGSKAHESRQAKALIPDLQKYFDIGSPVLLGSGAFGGSFEHMMQRIRKPVFEAVPCKSPQKYNDNGNVDYSSEGEGPHEPRHYLDIIATFPDHAYVRCSDENLLWKVPYEIDADGEIETGEPEAASITLAAQSERDDDADDEDILDPDEPETITTEAAS